VSYRRPRWRCDACQQECYPHDSVLRFLTHAVRWPLAKVCGRLAAQIPSFDDAGDSLAEVHLAKETIRRIAEAAGTMVLEQEDRQRQRIRERLGALAAE